MEEEEQKEYVQEAIIFKSNNYVVFCIFMVILFIMIIICVIELMRIYKYSRWIGPFPNVARSPPISYQLDNYLDDIYLGLDKLKYIPP